MSDPIQAGETPATTIRELVDACRQDVAGIGARLSSVRLRLDRGEHVLADDALDGLEAHLRRLNTKLNLALEEADSEKRHLDYGVALGEYNAGLLPWPPCERCCDPIPNAPFTGAEICNECLEAIKAGKKSRLD